jgi:hypothetical protein
MEGRKLSRFSVSPVLGGSFAYATIASMWAGLSNETSDEGSDLFL